ncbi:MAG TPA: hypothetical protein VEG32_15440 [Clostridia bacterium]|nr:hypothetical protein [Clostridia bacterium]
MACPYFSPEERCAAELWPHRARLPLGDGACGTCSAPGHEGERPTEDQLASHCNLGYARACPRRPAAPIADAVRFAVKKDSADTLLVSYVLEREHLPLSFGEVTFSCATAEATDEGRASLDDGIKRLAKFYVRSYLHRFPRQLAAAH